MLGLSYFVPLATRPCEYEVNPPAIVRACLIGMTAVAPVATQRCQAPRLNWMSTPFFRI
jgi:hypothetical protein